MSTVEELQAQVASLTRALEEERARSARTGPLIKVPQTRVSLKDQVLAIGGGGGNSVSDEQIPTTLRLVQAAMTQRAVTAAQYGATKAASAAEASEKVLQLLREKKVYSKHIKEAEDKVEQYRALETRLHAKEKALQGMFEDQRNATQVSVWPEITANIGRYNQVTKKVISSADQEKALDAFMNLFEAIAAASEARGTAQAHVSQPVPDGADPCSLAYFVQLYQHAAAARLKLDEVGIRLQAMARAGVAVDAGDGAEPDVTWHIGPLKTVDRALEKTMDGYEGRFNFLGDLARGSIECASLTAACAALKALLELQQQGVVDLVRCKNRIDPAFPAESGGGYRDGLINAVVKAGPPGHVCEIQIHMRDFLAVKHDGGHASYKAARALHLADPDLLTHRGTFSATVAEGVAGGMIQRLVLDYFALSAEEYAQLADAVRQPNCLLHTLSLRTAGADDAACQQLAAAMAARPVDRVTIAGDNKTMSPVTFVGAAAVIKNCGSALERLDMGSSSLRAPVADVFHSIAEHAHHGLRRLDLRKCGLTGFLDADEGQWAWATQLVYLNLEENPLTGALPDAVAALPRLSQLFLGYTKLAGQIPEAFAQAPNIQCIDVTATALTPGPQVLAMVGADFTLEGWAVAQAFGGEGEGAGARNAFLGGGRFMTTGFTRNDYDGNVSRAECALFEFAAGGVLQGGIDYSTGGNYNKAEATKITGAYHLAGLECPDRSKWTQWADGDQFHYVEKYHGGSSIFYYSGRIVGDRMVGRYKMGSRNATGTFEWKLVEVLHRANLTDDAASANQPGAAPVGGAAAAAAAGEVVAVVVSGAGSALIDGTYKRTDTFNNRPMYANATTGMELWNNHGQWRLGSTNHYYYLVRGRGAVPPADGWVRSELLCDRSLCAPGVKGPAPTLELRSAGDVAVAGANSGGGGGGAAAEPVPQQEGPPLSMVVEGAGTASVNGVYAPDGTYNGRRMFTAAATGMQIWWNKGQWRLGNTNSYRYAAESTSEQCPCSGWRLATELFSAGLCAKAEGPAPTMRQL